MIVLCIARHANTLRCPSDVTINTTWVTGNAKRSTVQYNKNQQQLPLYAKLITHTLS